MRRRLSLTMVAMVVAALVFAGLATLGLTVLNSVHQTQAELVVDAKKLAQGVDTEVATDRHHDSLPVLRSTLSVLNAPLKLQGEAVLAVRPDGSFVNLFSPGPTLDVAKRAVGKPAAEQPRVRLAGLRSNQPVSGHHRPPCLGGAGVLPARAGGGAPDPRRGADSRVARGRRRRRPSGSASHRCSR